MKYAFLPLMAIAAIAVAGCESTGGNTAAQQDTLNQRAQIALQEMTRTDPGLQNVINNAYGYAVFPDVSKAAVGIGAGGGNGVVYQQGQMVGRATLNQGSVGIQIGGESFAELVVFKDRPAMDVFENGNLNFGADATATAVKAGAAAATQFNNGTMIYVLPKGGLMAGVSILGQKFNFMPNGNNH
jgi:lipid-binding SYLF domain-containing protein